MLFVKGDYLFDEISFSFETNAAVAGKVVKGNDADLLQEWTNLQENLNNDLLKKIRDKLKDILSAYIEKEYQVKVQDIGLKPKVQEAANIFKNLEDDVFDRFIESIRWQFDAIDPNSAIQKQLDNVNLLLEKIPLPLKESKEVNMGLLYREVINRAIQENPNHRILSNNVMDFLLLQAGDEKNKWYAEVYEKWLDASEVKEFHTGEFYEVINASIHSRMNLYDSGHAKLWKKILLNYYQNVDFKIYYKRRVVYELIFLNLNPNPLNGGDMGSIAGL